MPGNFKRVAFPFFLLLIFTGLLLFLSVKQVENSRGPKPVINEVCTNNFSCLNDGYGNYPSWVELYNPTPFPLELRHFFLKDSMGKTGWRLPNTVLEPGAYILFAEDIPSPGKEKNSVPEGSIAPGAILLEKDEAYSTDDNFFNFSLSDKGDVLYLINTAGEVCDKCSIPETRYDAAYGRSLDGGGEWREQEPTPGYSNNGVREIISPVYESPSFSHESGFYKEGFRLEIEAGEGQEIFYTLDGSEPGPLSARYEGGITVADESGTNSSYAARDDLSAYTRFDVEAGKYLPGEKAVDKAVIVRAVSIDPQGRRSETGNRVFFIGYQGREEYEGVSILSLTADPGELFGNERGIYVLGREYEKYLESGETEEEPEQVEANYRIRGEASEREVYLEYFNEEHERAFSQRAGIRIRGGYSRANTQKSINIFARKIYEEGDSFKGSFFDSLIPETSVSLFCGGQDNQFKYIDELFSRLMEGRKVAVIHGKPCYLFLDGEFWGIYWLQERYEDYYFREHYRTARDSVKALKLDYHTEDDELLDERYERIWDFINSGRLGEEEVYKDFCQLVDIDSLIEYYAANIYIAHLSDWPRSNIGIWRSLITEPNNSYEDTRWRYYVFDVNSFSMEEPEHETLCETMGFDSLLRELFKNESFRLAFLEEFRELENSVFTRERVDKILEELEEEMGCRLDKTWERFFQSEWKKERLESYTKGLQSFFENRGAYIDGVIEHACLDYEDYMTNVFEKR